MHFRRPVCTCIFRGKNHKTMKFYIYAMRLMIYTCIIIACLNKYMFYGARSYLKERY